MVLLTSGQVSVAISSVVVFLFTSALFLSGYVLQQKTVNDIRRAIKPQIAPLRPDLVVPPKFREGEFWDGNVQQKAQVIIVEKTPETEEDGKKAEPAEDDMIGATRWQKAKKLKEREKLRMEAEAKARDTKEEADQKSKKKQKNKVKKNENEVEIKDLGSDDKSLTPAQRRKKIKEEVLAAGEGEGFKGYRRRMW